MAKPRDSDFVEVVANLDCGGGAFADRGGELLRGATSHVARHENSREAGSKLFVTDDETEFVEVDGLAQKGGIGVEPDEDERRRGAVLSSFSRRAHFELHVL